MTSRPLTAGPSRWVRWAALVLSLLGVADSSYLTVTHFDPRALSCSTSGFVNCLAVTQSAQSRIFGIPVAFLGLGFYVAMTAINLPVLWRRNNHRLAWLRLALTVVGMVVVVWLLFAELFVVKNLCEYCTGVHILTFLLFVLVVTTMPTGHQLDPTKADETSSAIGLLD